MSGVSPTRRTAGRQPGASRGETDAGELGKHFSPPEILSRLSSLLSPGGEDVMPLTNFTFHDDLNPELVSRTDTQLHHGTFRWRYFIHLHPAANVASYTKYLSKQLV